MSIYRLCTRIPVLGILIKVANAYAFAGSPEATARWAPPKSWAKAFGIELVIATALAAMSTGLQQLFGAPAEYVPDPGFVSNVGELITNVFPNLLGFGIGVYALIFGLSSTLLKQMQEAFIKKREANPSSHGSVLVVNAQLALPLVVLVTTIGIGVIARMFPCAKPIIAIAWIAFWYSLLMVLDVVHTLFLLGESELANKAKRGST